MLRRVDAAQALADLTEISSQVVQVAIVDAGGAVLATTVEPESRATRFVDGVARLVAEADAARSARGLPGLAQLEAATLEGSVFVVRDSDGGRTIAATTRPDPTVGLVFYDLKHCLRSIADEEPAPAPRRRKKAADGAE
jgi:predicted regulator of Ras-like GTPase activity (Roadblock/LC7/MglB family)